MSEALEKMKQVAILKKARAKIEKGWCQDYLATTDKGTPVSEKSRRAAKWCVLGAVGAVTKSSREAFRCQQLLREVAGVDFLSTWNNAPGRTQEQVIRLYDKAIARATP